MAHFSLVTIFIFLCLNDNRAILLNNVDIGTYQHLESLILNLNATVQAMNTTIEEKVHKLQQSTQVIQTLSNNVQSLMSKVNQLQQKQSIPPVAFLAETSKDWTNPAVGTTVIFDIIHLNDGGGYNNVHGIFTAPVSGVYHFTLELTTHPQPINHGVHVHLMKSTTAIGYVYLQDNLDFWLKRSATATVHLSKGDDIWAKVTALLTDGMIRGCCYHSIFSGFLIRAD